LKVRENLNAARKLGVALLFATLIFFSSPTTGNLVYGELTYFLRLGTLVGVLFLLYLFENDENVTQRRILLGLTAFDTCVGMALFVLAIVLLDGTSSEIIANALRTFTYFAVNLLLFVDAYRDYKMFGVGLREYYKEKHLRRLRLQK
jgi:hypothetical protein